MFGNARQKRQNERDFYQKTKDNENAATRGSGRKVTKSRSGPTPEWHYRLPGFALPFIGAIVLSLLFQYFGMVTHNLSNEGPDATNIFGNYRMGILHAVLWFIAFPAFWGYLNRQFRAVWFTNNAMHLTEDIEEYTTDSYQRTIDHLTQDYDVAPDAGLGFDGHASTITSHMMVSNKGIKPIMMPQFDPNVPGQVKRDANGNIVYKKMPMFNEKLADKLFDMSGVPQKFRELYDATDYDFNPKIKRKDGGDGKKRSGAFGRKAYDKLSDYINNEFYPLDSDTERPAGVYFYDSRPVNTILIAITRGGKGQTYIEPAFDVWTREKNKWNIFTTDPKGELLAKFYYPATVRGMDVVQFNLMHPNLTNVFNPLANAIQEFRRDNPVKGTAIIDSIIETLFPDNGEIWNPAAGNMFRRAVYMLFDYYIEQGATCS